jgi:hypothetical protein
MTIKSSGLSTLLSLSVMKTSSVLKENSIDYESYCLFRDKLIGRDWKIRQKNCSLCPGTDHSSLECPYYHYMPKRTIVIARYIKN